MARPEFGCGRKKCGASTGFMEEPTFGTGRLDFWGYWEHGCDACARAFEKVCPKYGPCWPPPKAPTSESP